MVVTVFHALVQGGFSRHFLSRMRLLFSARERSTFLVDDFSRNGTADERSPGSVRCRSKKERHARVRATPLDLRA